MLRINLALLILAFSISISAETLTGSWRMEPIPESTQTFDLQLIQSGEKLCGLHFGSAKGGAKIDSSFGSDQKATISGMVGDSVAQVTLISSQSPTPILGTIRYVETHLEWEVNEPGKHRVATIPKKAKLMAISPFELGNKKLEVLCE